LNLFGIFNYVSQSTFNMVNEESRKQLFKRPDGTLAEILSRRNVVCQIGKYIFCHAGITPGHLDLLEDTYGSVNLENLNELFRKFVLKQSISPLELKLLNKLIVSSDGILWTRVYMNKPVTELDKILTELLSRTNAVSMFVGHNRIETITSVCESKLFFADAGLSRTFNTTKVEVIEITNSKIEVITIPYC
jgi:hypothetical protein